MIDDPRQAIEVGRVIGHHQGIAAGIGIHGAGGTDQRPQGLQHLRGRLVLQCEDAGLGFAAHLALALAGDRGSIKFRVRLGQDEHHVIDFDGGIALHAQRGQDDFVGHLRRDRLRRCHLQGSLDARIYDDGLAADAAHGLDHRTDLGIDKVQGDFFGRSTRGEGGTTQQAGKACRI
jgi:hypothetical protein